MTRRSLSNLLSNQERNLRDVWGWYELQRTLIGEEKSRVLDALVMGASLATSRYVGKTREELENDFAAQTAELGLMAMLGMLACTEAALRVDFIERVRSRRKDAVSRAFRSVYKKRKQRVERVRLEEDILDIWRRHGPGARIKNAIAEFKGALNLRNWLAHGRYWKPKLGRAAGYDPVDVFDISRELLEATELMPPESSTAAGATPA